MERNSTKAVAAEVSVRENGALYIGIEARRKIDAYYNDNVKVEIPSLGRVVRGSINSGGSIIAGKAIAELVLDKDECRHAGTEHVDAIVKRVTGTWDDDNGLTEERHEKVHHLDSNDL